MSFLSRCDHANRCVRPLYMRSLLRAVPFMVLQPLASRCNPPSDLSLNSTLCKLCCRAHHRARFGMLMADAFGRWSRCEQRRNMPCLRRCEYVNLCVCFEFIQLHVIPRLALFADDPGARFTVLCLSSSGPDVRAALPPVLKGQSLRIQQIPNAEAAAVCCLSDHRLYLHLAAL